MLAATVIAVVVLAYLTGPLGKSRGVNKDKGTPPQRLAAAPVVASMRVLRMLDANAGWGLAGTYVLRTEDGARTWLDGTPGEITGSTGQPGETTGAFFLDAKHAWVTYGGSGAPNQTVVFRTADGGLTWAKSNAPVGGMGYELFFLDANRGWILAHQGVAGGSEAVALAASTDGGAKWTLVSQANPQVLTPGGLPFGGNKTGVSFSDASRGWLGGFAPFTGKAFLYHTADGGKNWQDAALPAPVYLREAMFTTTPPTFFGAKDGVLPAQFSGLEPSMVFYATHDGGATWTPGTQLKSGTDRGLSWSFADALHGFASDGASLYATADGGVKWATVKPKPDGTLAQVLQLSFASDKVGWAITGGRIFKTTDGGQNWTKVNP